MCLLLHLFCIYGCFRKRVPSFPQSPKLSLHKTSRAAAADKSRPQEAGSESVCFTVKVIKSSGVPVATPSLTGGDMKIGWRA